MRNSERRAGKGAQRRAHVSVNEDCESAVGTFRFAHPSVTGLDWSIPFALSTRRFSLLYGVGARPPPDGV
jgi:hypothetical protein